MRWALFVLLMAGCGTSEAEPPTEDDAQTLVQLRDTERRTELDVAVWGDSLLTFEGADLDDSTTLAEANTVNDSLNAARARLDIVRRDIDRLLR